jgi:hypothetical protein
VPILQTVIVINYHFREENRLLINRDIHEAY